MAKASVKTPKAVAGYAHVNRPSKFGKYELTLRFKSEKEVADIVAKAKELAEEEFGPKKAAKVKMPFGKDEASGDFTIKATSKYPPTVYNAKGSEIDEERVPAVYGGSVVKAGLKLETYNGEGKTGVIARLSSVQLIKLVTSNGGFDDESADEEEAYVGDGVEARKSTKPASTSKENDDEDEGDEDDDATAF